MKNSHWHRKGSILALAIIGLMIGSLVVGALMKYSSMDTLAVQREIGSLKARNILVLATNYYNKTLGQNQGTMNQTQIDELTMLIGGGGLTKPIFGESAGGTPSSIPGFSEYTVNWDSTSSGVSTTMTPPDRPDGFWYFPGTMTATITATHEGDSVPATRRGARALFSSQNETRTVPVFSMLSFYDRDWEISAHFESAQLIGRIHSNGSIYLDCRDNVNDTINFRGLQNYPTLSADKFVYRRGRNGATSYYKYGSQANRGLFFTIYNQTDFNSLIDTNLNFYFNNPSPVFNRDLRPGFTNSEFNNDQDTDNSVEAEARRFGGHGVDFGYVYRGTYTNNGSTTTFTAPDTNGDPVDVIQFGDAINNLQPPVAIDPYQYIEDIQFYDTPDTINFPPPLSSNYQEDSANGDKIVPLAFNSIAPLVIRDGVAYYRTSVGGNLTPVLNLLNASHAYPDASHTDAKVFGDLRWYGWFGMNSGVSSPTPDNPARWHFPIKSVTFNKTRDAQNGGHGSTSSEGTAIEFTFRSSTVINPMNDAVKSTGGATLNPSWISNVFEIDPADLAGYPAFNTSVATDPTTGAGVGMYNVSYPTIEGDSSTELYDPVRVGYNIVKATVRNMYNQSHIYTSRHSDTKMLHNNGDTPGDGEAPDIWGSNIKATHFGGGVDYNGDGIIDFSAFWNDDGAILNDAGNPVETLYQYRRVRTAANHTDSRAGFLELTGGFDNTSRVELFPIRHSSVTNMSASPASMDQWYIYKSTLPLSNRTLPMPLSRDLLDGWDYTSNSEYFDNNTLNGSSSANHPRIPGINTPRVRNFGFAGGRVNTAVVTATSTYRNSTNSNANYHNWFTLLNNAPEMLVRQNSNANTHSNSPSTPPGITFEEDFDYFGGDWGGYYGNDNLCMIDQQEKKIVVFTEIDLAELTSECFIYNKLNEQWGFTFDNNPATITVNPTTQSNLQNIIYVVNTSMGRNFFNRRVHTGAVRIKRGRLLTHPLSIVSPNAVHVWGDFNAPGYWHHGKYSGNSNVSYTVPNTKEYTGTNVQIEPTAIYSDSISAYENSWIRFNQSSTTSDSLRDSRFGSLRGPFTKSSGVDKHNDMIYYDHKLWWEDDGIRRSGGAGDGINEGTGYTPLFDTFGAQLFLNYHETIFKHDKNNYYTTNSVWGRQRSAPILKHIPQCINAGLMYGNVTSKQPSYFLDANIQPILGTRPSSVDLLTWSMSYVPRSNWTEMTRNEMNSANANALDGSNGFDPTQNGSQHYDFGSNLTPSNYYGRVFVNQTTTPSANQSRFEEVKLAFSGGGFLYDIRYHTNHTFWLKESWGDNGNYQTFGRNINGAFSCLFDSRQSTHGFNFTNMGTECQQIFYAFDQRFLSTDNLPPGTPMTTIIPNINYTIEGSKWAFE